MKVSNIPKMLELQPRDITTLFLGPPGIGKSEVVIEYAKKMAEKLKLRFVDLDEAGSSLALEELKEVLAFKDLRLTDVADVSDLVGYPQVRNGFAEYVPWRWIYCLAKAAAGVLFLDELTNVQRQDIIAAAYKLTNERKLGFIKLPKTVQIIAAGNSPEYSALANELPTPLVSRMRIFKVNPPSLQEWVDHMVEKYGTGWDTRIAGYLTHFNSDFIAVPKEPQTLQPYPCPRSWTRLGLQLKNAPPEMLEELAEAFVGPEVGSRFAAFCRINVDLEQLLTDTRKFFGLNTEGKWLASSMLASRIAVSKEIDSKAIDLFATMLEEREFAVLVITLLPKTRRHAFFNAVKHRPAVLAKIAALSDAIKKYVDL